MKTKTAYITDVCGKRSDAPGVDKMRTRFPPVGLPTSGSKGLDLRPSQP